MIRDKMTKTLLATALAVSALPAGAQDGAVADSAVVNMPWQVSSQPWSSAHAGVTVRAEELESSASTDLRGMLTGKIPGLELTESAGAVGLSGSTTSLKLGVGNYQLSSRGFSSLVLIVDDVPVPFNQLLLQADQIESVTLLSDVASKALYGPVASYGALYVKTRRGAYNRPLTVSVDASSGISIVDRMPEWVSGSEYAGLNNEARSLAGYPTLYTERAMEGFAAGDPFDRQYPNVDYKSLIYRDVKPLSRFGVNISGGSSTVKYSTTINGLNEGDIVKVGPTADFNRLNLSSSVTAKVGRYIEANASFVGMTSFRRRSNMSFSDYRETPAVAFPLAFGRVSSLEGVDDVKSGSTVYAVSRVFGDNPYALLVEGGSYTDRYRSGMFHASVDVDCRWLLKGLKSRTFVNLNSFFHTRNGRKDDYLAYYWDADAYVGDLSSHRGAKQSGKSVMSSTTYQSLNFYERLYWDWERGGHKVDAGALFYMSSVNHTGSVQRERQQNLILNAGWSWKDKYLASLSMAYSGTSRLKKGHRYDVFPAGTLTWVLSEEPFMRGLRAVGKAKAYAQAGLIGAADVFGTGFLYQANYALSNGRWYGPSEKSGQWFGDNRDRSEQTTIKRLANPSLGWAKIFQADAGVSLELFDCIDVNLAGYYVNRYGIVSDITSGISGIWGMSDISVYQNYSAKRTLGGELTVGWSRSFGDFRAAASVDAMSWKITDTKVVGDFYEYGYQKKTGADADAIWGLECIGRFESEEQLASLPKYTESAQIGDLIYKDQNGDGKIDVNDNVVIGNSSPRLRYSVNLSMGWKGLELNVVGTGRAFCENLMNNEWFWNGWGDGNYSAFVRDNIGGDYPRLSYDKATDNFVNSSFWVKKTGWFKIQDVELAYGMKFRHGAFREMRLSLRGGNLCTISQVKDVDPESLDSGVTAYPLFRTVTAGVKLKF